jgi:hypothetical protein
VPTNVHDTEDERLAHFPTFPFNNLSGLLADDPRPHVEDQRHAWEEKTALRLGGALLHCITSGRKKAPRPGHVLECWCGAHSLRH